MSGSSFRLRLSSGERLLQAGSRGGDLSECLLGIGGQVAGKRPVPCGFTAGGTAGCRWSEGGEEITCKSPVLSSTCGATGGSL